MPRPQTARKSVTRGILILPLQYVLIIHEVENYTAWKKIFDGVRIRR